MDQPIITQDNPQPFIVRVKLLTNQVFEFEVDKNMKVADFKALASPKVNVPVDRMRIVFAGKQLLDDKPLSDYVSQTGMTVHLIARSAPVSQAQSQPVQSNPSVSEQPSNSSTVPPQNPFGDIMGMMGSIFGQPPGNGPQPQIISSFGNFVNLGGMLGNLGMRGPGPNQGGSIQMNIPLSPQSQPINLQPQPQTQPPTNPQPSPSQTHPQPSTQPQRISYAQISQLNQNINTLNIPLDNVTTNHQNLTPQGVIRYLRRLHHQSTRSMLQLNRLLNLAQANNNNTAHLEGFVPVLESLNATNNVAINCLNQLRSNRTAQNQGGLSGNTGSGVVQSVSNPLIMEQNPLISIVVQQTDQNGNTQIFSTQGNQPSNLHTNTTRTNTNQTTPIQTNTQNPQPRSQPQAQQSQPLQPNSQPQLGNPLQMMNPMSMLGGLNLGGIFGQLQSVGGVNGLFGMNLREMMSENGNVIHNSIFLDLFGGMSGSNLMQLFIAKDFKFLKDKQAQIRTILKNKINQSNQQQVIQKITDEVALILFPNTQTPIINNRQACIAQCRKNIKKYVKKLIETTMSQNQSQYDVKVLQICKRAFCQNINIVSKYTTNHNTNVVFQIMKTQAIGLMEPILPGISGMFYGLIERDLFRVYNQFQAEQERRRQMSAEQQKSEQRLIEMIKEVGAKDSDVLANMKHSETYQRQ